MSQGHLDDSKYKPAGRSALSIETVDTDNAIAEPPLPKIVTPNSAPDSKNAEEYEYAWTQSNNNVQDTVTSQGHLDDSKYEPSVQIALENNAPAETLLPNEARPNNINETTEERECAGNQQLKIQVQDTASSKGHIDELPTRRALSMRSQCQTRQIHQYRF